jgi:hypothetical protein
MPNFVGRMNVPTTSGTGTVWFESMNERHHLIDLIIADGVVHIATQPARIAWHFGRAVREHTPDILARRSDGTWLLVDVTRSSKLAEVAAAAIFALTARTAEALGWDYELRTELPLQRARNLRWLWTHACLRQQGPRAWRGLLDELEWPLPWRDVAETLGDAPVGHQRLCRAVELRELFIDLDRPVDSSTLVDRRPIQVNRPWIAAI